jgi:polysaccharide deacetylase family protein (PEP-CTERM system associated)
MSIDSAKTAADRAIVNAMSVDVEDYFQVSAFAGTVSRADWDRFDCRVERNTDAVLAMFADHGARATFFTLGWVAQRCPALVRRIVEQGHELASHGDAHFRVSDQSPDEFREDVRRTKRLLEDTGGVAVTGYRAASFSIGDKTPWAFEVLAEEGHTYSSSVYPIRHDHYGMPDAPRFSYRPDPAQGLVEVPITTVNVFGRNLPSGGGGYFRLLPYAVSRWAIRRVNNTDRKPAIFYFHPWEVDPGQPRMSPISARTRFRHYTNLGRMEPRLRMALDEFAWDRMDRVFADDFSEAA